MAMNRVQFRRVFDIGVSGALRNGGGMRDGGVCRTLAEVRGYQARGQLASSVPVSGLGFDSEIEIAREASQKKS